MRILQENLDLTQRELAEKLDISVRVLNYCLKALVENGLVKMKNFANSKNKFWLCLCAHPNWHGRKGCHYPPVSAAQNG